MIIQAEQQDFDFITASISGLTDEENRLLVTEWAEQKRYLPSELTSKPGNWDNDYTAYLKKPMDAFSSLSPTKKIAIIKGAQIGATTGILENALGYTIEHDPCGMMYVSGDAELAKTSIELKVDRMIKGCGLEGLIKNPDPGSKKSGNTTNKKDFVGGFLLSYGAKSPNKMRSLSVRKALGDEVDSWPEALGSDGDTLKLLETRTKAFEETRKIMYLSTPLVMQTSRIWRLYQKGDQQHYYVPCKHCGHMQYLRLQGVREDGKKFAFKYEVDDDYQLITDSVEYICEACLKPWKNYDKSWFLPRGEWRATAKPKEPGFESYSIPSFLAPVGMYSWESMCLEWLEWWDEKNQRVKDIESYRVFRNTVEGWPFEERGAAPKYEKVIQHRRATYSRNQIKNDLALNEAGSKVLILTCACDVHKDRIDLEIVGWCKGGRSYSIDWRSLEGDTEDLDSDASPWQKLSKIVENETWTADNGDLYNVSITFVDAGYRTDEVYQFCAQYSEAVYPIFGRDSLPKNKTYKTLFHESKNKYGDCFYSINHNSYKDRLAAWLRSDWKDKEEQPVGYPNYPEDYGDDFFRMYEAEEKVVEYHKKTKQRLGYYWRQTPNKPNHAWDCRVYGMAALDFFAFNICTTELELDGIVYDEFWKWLAENF